jgi:DNA-binding GntR family transcriptional regulator
MSPLQKKALQALDGVLKKFQPGDPLPSERELSEGAEVTRTVIRGLLSTLEARGLVRREERQWVLLKRIPASVLPHSKEAPVSKRQKVKEHLLTELGTGKLKPGQQISELAISKHLEVANISVREAMLELVPLGIFSKNKTRQWEVTAFEDDKIRELREFREIIELFCLRKLLADGLPQDRCLEIRDIRAKTQHIVDSRNPSTREIIAIDLRFHRFLIEASGNRLLVERSAFIYLIIEFQLAAPLFLQKRSILGLKQHLTILDAILKQDLPSAESHLLKHIQAAEETFHSIVHKSSFGGE